MLSWITTGMLYALFVQTHLNTLSWWAITGGITHVLFRFDQISKMHASLLHEMTNLLKLHTK